MAVQKTQPNDDGVADGNVTSTDRTPQSAGADLSSFSQFDGSADTEKTTLDLDAFAPYKPTGSIIEPAATKSFEDTDAAPTTPISLDETPDFDSFAASDFATGLSGLHAGPIGSIDDEPALSFVDASTAVRPSRLFIQIGKFSANYDLEGDDLSIGRPDNVSNVNPDIVIEWDDAISRRHARLFLQNGVRYLEDLGSTNGTKVNGMTLGAHTPHELSDGDVIHLGSKTEISYYK
jgi:hypothetical protein